MSNIPKIEELTRFWRVEPEMWKQTVDEPSAFVCLKLTKSVPWHDKRVVCLATGFPEQVCLLCKVWHTRSDSFLVVEFACICWNIVDAAWQHGYFSLTGRIFGLCISGKSIVNHHVKIPWLICKLFGNAPKLSHDVLSPEFTKSLGPHFGVIRGAEISGGL